PTRRSSDLVLVGVLAVDADGAAGGEVLRGEDRHQRGLAGAVAPEQPVDGVLLEREADVVERERVAVALAEVAHLDHVGHRGSPFVGRWAARARSAIIRARSSGTRPSRAAATRSGSRNRSAKAVRRSVSSSSRAPGATNIPMPRRL